ncbi:MAG: histone deacetylase [Sulfolobales archaeon]|nr:histone deacetylase [Sulfolobales archaeon]MCX8186583.1 histone deacetylase [Sulfolobales archaeon]
MHKDPSGSHPENVWRIEDSMRELSNSPAQSLIDLVKCSKPDITSVVLVHDLRYVEWVENECSKGFHYIDPDTYVTEHTYNVALAFATTARDAAIDAVRTSTPWFILARPGGHHAGRSGPAMGAPTLGFCIFDYISVAAKTLINQGLRVMIIDFDAHHGNGTQEILWDEPKALHIDIHQRWIYPGTGGLEDVGGLNAKGTKINIPLYPYSNDSHYAYIINNIIETARNVFQPDVILVFAGFDAHKDDKLTQLRVTEDLYSLFGHYLRELLEDKLVRGLISILGGGYGKGMVKSLKSYVEGLTGVSRKPSISETSLQDDILNALRKNLNLLKTTVETS